METSRRGSWRNLLGYQEWLLLASVECYLKLYSAIVANSLDEVGWDYEVGGVPEQQRLKALALLMEYPLARPGEPRPNPLNKGQRCPLKLEHLVGLVIKTEASREFLRTHIEVRYEREIPPKREHLGGLLIRSVEDHGDRLAALYRMRPLLRKLDFDLQDDGLVGPESAALHPDSKRQLACHE